jgi:hypothetical protein
VLRSAALAREATAFVTGVEDRVSGSCSEGAARSLPDLARGWLRVVAYSGRFHGGGPVGRVAGRSAKDGSEFQGDPRQSKMIETGVSP